MSIYANLILTPLNKHLFFMKILLITTSLGMGGAEHVVTNLADKLVSYGHEVKICYLTGPVLVKPESKSVEITSLNIRNYKDIPKAYFKIMTISRIFKPDVIHSHMYHANILARLLRISTPVPKLICTSHSNFEGGKLRMLVYKITDILATISTNVSQSAVNSMVSKGAYNSDRVISIPNGIDTEKFKLNQNSRIRVRKDLGIKDEKMILAVGRMSPAKDYPNLFQSIALLKQYRNDFIVYIVGEGPLKQSLIALAEKLDITDMIVMLGIRYDIPDLMSACDIFVLSSAWEGFGLVVAEAMACERPVIATDCGGVKEIVYNHGFLVEPKDSNLLFEALNKVLDMCDIEKSLIGKSARTHIIENFSLKNNVDAYIRLYKG